MAHWIPLPHPARRPVRNGELLRACRPSRRCYECVLAEIEPGRVVAVFEALLSRDDELVANLQRLSELFVAVAG